MEPERKDDRPISSVAAAGAQMRDYKVVLTGSDRKQFVEVAVKSRLLAAYSETRLWISVAEVVGVDRADLYPRAAVYVDKILADPQPWRSARRATQYRST